MRLSSLLPGRPFPAPAPAAPFRAIGDIHGCADLLARALDRPGPPAICLGDMVDRGPDSAGVLRMLAARPDIPCLMGNHEEMLLAFLNDPDLDARWLRHGGAETLESFGLQAPSPDAPLEAVAAAAHALAKAMGPDLIAWLAALPSLWRSGNVAVVHAAADPARPIPDQRIEVLRWGHRDFRHRRRRDGVWVVHGHVVVERPICRAGVASIDTGAWVTGRLTTAHVTAGGIRFEEA